ncbi:Coenzyme F420 hydrogenase/dehydrogenase, beta subunit C-terminal domain [Bosea sp. CS1GBMeth4]|uniref:Coenzyme F420 hydrogenase/dehydrogenase, beta subunit C-terminal domain n=1 Tax=Bosea sp. CS1GBMeth4 TaxID=1892849 RepID=UPI00164762BE|nr:Coenzyme F420 hydrogenase/dehydrogenase, beta subunit C-terminal domain [Bosea sp. CS1GBMeth4]
MDRTVPDRIAPRDVIDAGLCIGCGACVALASASDAGMAWNSFGQLEPRGSDGWRHTRTAELARTCPFSPHSADEDALAAEHFPDAPQRDAHIGRFRAAYVGHAAEGQLRASGSSGGMVTWVAVELLRRGWVDAVVHVAPLDPAEPDRRLFGYRLSRSEQEVRRGSRSRYYPVELSEAVASMRATPGRYAVIGIPCFIKAVRLLCREDEVLRERVAFTLGLFCGHMKSARMVESFAWQTGADPGTVAAIDFRLKDARRPANWYRAELTLDDGRRVAEDWWHFADGDWGAGFFQSSACNYCDDLVAETADIAFGDAWVEPYASDGRGTNVVIVRSAQLDAIVRAGLEAGRLALTEVDGDFVRRTQEAGFRQRREGLAYRLGWRRRGLAPRKRVRPGSDGITLRRRLVYRMRASISRWSHRVFRLARALRLPSLYLLWARAALAIYQALTYSRGRLGRFVDWVENRFRDGRSGRQ